VLPSQYTTEPIRTGTFGFPTKKLISANLWFVSEKSKKKKVETLLFFFLLPNSCSLVTSGSEAAKEAGKEKGTETCGGGGGVGLESFFKESFIV
jgi:hypothetical protein